MAEVAVGETAAATRNSSSLVQKIAWRNLWRNKRRTWLTAGGIAFAILLIVFSMSMQSGSYVGMIDNATSMLAGHGQVLPNGYLDNPKINNTISNATELVRAISAVAGVVSVAPRAETFALVSAGERSFGAQVLGIDPQAEANTVNFFDRLVEGVPPDESDEGLVGELLARNLGVALGDEIVVLGTGKQGGVAALVIRISGIFDSGIDEVDRGLLMVPLTTVQNEFDLGDEAHRIVIRTSDIDRTADTMDDISRLLPSDGLVGAYNWDKTIPDLRQAIELDKLSARIMYLMIILLVTFSVVNTFIMTVFERRREFGVLMALGMRRGQVLGMLLIESFWLWLLGAAIGFALATIVIGWLAQTGIYLGDSMQQLAQQMFVPTHIFPSFSLEAAITAPLVLLVGTQLAAFIPGLKVLRLNPIEAIRSE